MSGPITITKLDAARRQLRTAIELWFADGDPVSIHALAGAAHQIIHDLNRRNKGPSLLLDTDWIKEEFRKQFIALAKAPMNFFKHADNRGKIRSPTSVEMHPVINDIYILFALRGLKHLGQPQTSVERAYCYWHSFHTSRWLSETGTQFIKQIPVKDLVQIQGMSKLEFFETFLSGEARSTSRGDLD